MDIYTSSHFENGCDVTVYFLLDRTETDMLLSGCAKIVAGLQKGIVKTLAYM